MEGRTMTDQQQGYTEPASNRPLPSVPDTIRAEFCALMSLSPVTVGDRVYQVHTPPNFSALWRATETICEHVHTAHLLTRAEASAYLLPMIWPGETIIVVSVPLETVEQTLDEHRAVDRQVLAAECPLGVCELLILTDGKPGPDTCEHYATEDGERAWFVSTRREMGT
jgi:hypothetical protein